MFGFFLSFHDALSIKYYLASTINLVCSPEAVIIKYPSVRQYFSLMRKSTASYMVLMHAEGVLSVHIRYWFGFTKHHSQSMGFRTY